MKKDKNKKSFIEKHPVFGGLILIAAYAIEYSKPQFKNSLNIKKENLLNKLFKTKEKFLNTTNHRVHKLIDNAVGSLTVNEDNVILQYQKIDKSNTDEDLLISLYKKCVVNNKLPNVAIKILEDLKPQYYEDALNASIRNSSVETIDYMFKQPKFNKSLKLNHTTTINQLMTRSIRYDQAKSIHYMLDHTRAFAALTDAPTVHKLLSICEKDELKNSLKALLQYDINLLGCETLAQSNFFTTNAPLLANSVLEQKLQNTIPSKKVAGKKKI